MGCGAVHCIKNKYNSLNNKNILIRLNSVKFKSSRRCSAGAEKWLHFKKWPTTIECLTDIKNRGYQIIATHASSESISIKVINLYLIVIIKNE